MNSFSRKLLTNWRRLGLPFSGSAAVVAVSGGADSVALLLAINELRRRCKLEHRFIVAHFDHGIRGKESRDDAQFVKRLAEKYDFGFAHRKGKIERRGNLEQNARAARYRFLYETAVENDAFAVLTAHTINDQAETFLINLLRGSGPDGLRAMPSIRPLAAEQIAAKFENQDALAPEILLVRPMLEWCRRQETEDFCRTSGVDFRTDAMNSDPRFMRVRIRRELIPKLLEFNPAIIETLARTAIVMSLHGEDSLEAAADDELSIRLLKALPKNELFAAIRRWIKHRRGNLRSLQLKHIEAIERLVNSRKSGKTVELPGGCRVIKSGGMLVMQDKS